MPSLWIVDGYNFIRSSSRFAEWEAVNPQAGKNAALQWLGNFSQNTGEQLLVVFDAYGGLLNSPQRSQSHGIEVMESRGSYTADEEIIQLVQTMGQNAIVVSSDREVQRGSLKAGCSILSSQEFEREVGKILNRSWEDDDERRSLKTKGRAFQPPKEKKKAYKLLRKYQ